MTSVAGFRRLERMHDASEPTASDGDHNRVVVDLATGPPTISGTLTSTLGSRSFWGWLELMRELERVAPEAKAKGSEEE
jgi:hypothetical protein